MVKTVILRWSNINDGVQHTRDFGDDWGMESLGAHPKSNYADSHRDSHFGEYWQGLLPYEAHLWQVIYMYSPIQ
jgi:hypothetical protein